MDDCYAYLIQDFLLIALRDVGISYKLKQLRGGHDLQVPLAEKVSNVVSVAAKEFKGSRVVRFNALRYINDVHSLFSPPVTHSRTQVKTVRCSRNAHANVICHSQNVVFTEISVHQAALLKHFAHDFHQLVIGTGQLAMGHFRILETGSGPGAAAAAVRGVVGAAAKGHGDDDARE